jgi:hypothetical protein
MKDQPPIFNRYRHPFGHTSGASEIILYIDLWQEGKPAPGQNPPVISPPVVIFRRIGVRAEIRTQNSVSAIQHKASQEGTIKPSPPTITTSIYDHETTPRHTNLNIRLCPPSRKNITSESQTNILLVQFPCIPFSIGLILRIAQPNLDLITTLSEDD